MSRVQVTKCVKIPSETCRDVPVAHCKAVPTRTAVLRTVKVTTDDNVTFDKYSCDCPNAVVVVVSRNVRGARATRTLRLILSMRKIASG